ncbi:MAG TPA: glycosyltransferase family 2 protein, partial [Anaerolineae bacterium]|nr:glycosyltransferase family 2 protein [Anaerolineae bacterium]
MTILMTPAIVIPAYNRPKTLARLLASLDRAH